MTNLIIDKTNFDKSMKIMRQTIWSKIDKPNITYQRIAPILVMNKESNDNFIDCDDYLKLNYSSSVVNLRHKIKTLITDKLYLNRCPVFISVSEGTNNMYWMIGDDRVESNDVRIETVNEIKSILTELHEQDQFELNIIDVKAKDINEIAKSVKEMEINQQQEKELTNLIKNDAYSTISFSREIEGVEYIGQKNVPDPFGNELLFLVVPKENVKHLYDNIKNGVYTTISHFPPESRGYIECMRIWENYTKRIICEKTSMIKFTGVNKIQFCGNNQNKGFKDQADYELHLKKYHNCPSNYRDHSGFKKFPQYIKTYDDV